METGEPRSRETGVPAGPSTTGGGGVGAAVKRRPWLAAWLPVLLFEAAVLYLSTRPNLRVPSGVPYLDKVAHFGEYAVLGWLLFRALRLSGGGRRESALSTILAIAFLGAGDEVFQRQIPGRFSSLRDWLADLAGGVVGAFLAGRFERRWPKLFGHRILDHD